MARKSPLDNLRAEVSRLQGAATKKISYNRRVKGVELGGTQYDPRRDPSSLKGMRRNQLERIKSELSHFMDRSNAFVPLRGGKPAPINEWRAYKRDERAVGRIGRRIDDRLSSAKIPNLGMTPAEYQEHIKTKRVTAAGSASTRPFAQRDRKSTNIPSLDALRKLRMDMQARQTPEYLQKVLTRNRLSAEKMLTTAGGYELNEAIKRLSDEQFSVLWDYWNLAEALQPRYEAGKNSLIEGDFSDSMIEVGDLIRDAAQLNPGKIYGQKKTRSK